MSEIIIKKWSVLRNLSKEFVANINLVYVFGTNGKQVIITTNDDNVYAFGDNCPNGCLGLGHTSPVTEPTKIVAICGIGVEQIEFGLNFFAMARTHTGYLYSWGYNENGELGLGNTISQLKPNSITRLRRWSVADVRCGTYHSVALTVCGLVFVWGFQVRSVPTEIDFYSLNQKMVSISCGRHHALALTNTGVVYYWGKNKYGQCGNGTNADSYGTVWQQIRFTNDTKIVKMVCGPNHSMLLSIHGNVYCFGRNDFGQLGDESNVEKNMPKKVSVDTKFKNIAAVNYNNISVALSADGFCYVWGECGEHTFKKPIKIPFSDINEAIECFSKERLTFKPLSLNNTPNNSAINVNSMWNRISEKFDKPEYSDVMFKVENKKIFAQKAHLINVCKHFETMFAQNWIESIRNEIEIENYSYAVYYAFIKYLYTNSVNINAEQAIDLMDLANCYLEDELKQRCVQLIKSSISKENVIAMYCSAAKYNSQELKNACTDYFLNNMKDRSDAGNILENAAKQFTR